MLRKVVNGITSDLATYSGSYTLTTPFTLAIRYNSGGTISVTATRQGQTTTLFSGVQDSSLVSGKIGIGTLYGQITVDEVAVTPNE